MVIGLTSMYREGFEVVLFLQNIRLQVGSHFVLLGALIGLFFTGIVALLNFVAHQKKLPYKKMLIITGALLVVVLLVMTGETALEMQQAGWIPTTKKMDLNIPDWMGVWFSIFPNVETLVAQGFAFVFVVGSYVFLQFTRSWKPKLAEKKLS